LIHRGEILVYQGSDQCPAGAGNAGTPEKRDTIAAGDIGQRTGEDWPISDPTSWPDASQPNGGAQPTFRHLAGYQRNRGRGKLREGPCDRSCAEELPDIGGQPHQPSEQRPQTGEAKAVSKDMEPVLTPDQISMPFVDPTPNCGSE
jgi:hypothetical protein